MTYSNLLINNLIAANDCQFCFRSFLSDSRLEHESEALDRKKELLNEKMIHFEVCVVWYGNLCTCPLRYFSISYNSMVVFYLILLVR